MNRASARANLRVSVNDHKIEEVVSLKDVKCTGFGGGLWIGLTPGNSPLLLHDTGSRRFTLSIGTAHKTQARRTRLTPMAVSNSPMASSAAVSLRMAEFGIRIALGSSRPSLIRLVLLEASKPVTTGIVLGSLASIGAAHAIRSLLYETSPTDSGSIAVSVSLLLVATFLAAFFPAYRVEDRPNARAAPGINFLCGIFLSMDNI